MKHKKTWKAVETRFAKELGGERVPITGRTRGATPDVAHPVFSIECKMRKSVPFWIKDAVAQAVAAVRGNQLPIAVIHETGDRYDDALVVMRFKDFKDWHGTQDLEL